jgi:hypothetical protein
MKFRLIEEEKSHHPVSRIARVLGVTRAGYHARKERPASTRLRATSTEGNSSDPKAS